MVFEDYYDNFFKARRSLEDPYTKVAISKKEYEKLQKIAANYEMLLKKFEMMERAKSELEKELELLKEDGRKLKELEQENEKFMNSLLRTKADFENYKNSVDRNNKVNQQRMKAKIAQKLIKHAEDLERALKVLETLPNDESIQKGFKIIVENFKKMLEEEGIRPMISVGEKFDPYKHEALMIEERDDVPENTVIEEIDKGYYINNEILKPAGVKVSKFKSKNE
jgi:molecular chaperone GrpE